MAASRPLFVSEFELPRRHEDEISGWPDFALVWPDRLVMIELKTEAGSHRPGQLAHYADLAGHHHPDKRRELVYLTPTLRASAVLDERRLLASDLVRGPPAAAGHLGEGTRGRAAGG